MVSHFLHWKLYQSKQINVQCVVIVFGYRFNFWPHKIYHIFIQSRTCSCMVLNICAGEHHPASPSLVSSTHCLSLQFWATLPSLCGSLHKCCSAVLSRIKLIFLLEKKIHYFSIKFVKEISVCFHSVSFLLAITLPTTTSVLWAWHPTYVQLSLVGRDYSFVSWSPWLE